MEIIQDEGNAVVAISQSCKVTHKNRCIKILGHQRQIKYQTFIAKYKMHYETYEYIENVVGVWNF